jgi:hypothetical protein
MGEAVGDTAPGRRRVRDVLVKQRSEGAVDGGQVDRGSLGHDRGVDLVGRRMAGSTG